MTTINERGNTSFEDFGEYMADQRHDDAAFDSLQGRY